MSSRTFHEWLKRRLAFITMKIRHGPLQGKRWNISSGSKFTRGEYEPDNTRAIETLVKPRDVVFDVGAHVGYFTVLMSERVGPDRVRLFRSNPAISISIFCASMFGSTAATTFKSSRLVWVIMRAPRALKRVSAPGRVMFPPRGTSMSE